MKIKQKRNKTVEGFEGFVFILNVPQLQWDGDGGVRKFF